MKKTKKLTKKEPIRRRVRRRAQLTMVPHAANGFHPHLVRWYGIAAMLLVAVMSFAASHVMTGSSILGVKANITAVDLLNDTNAERTKQGEKPLAYNEQLSTAAYLKAKDMFAKQYWAHTAPNGTTPWHWFAEAGYNYADAGENLAKNFTTTDATIAAWMASTHHRENILNTNYTDVGFAVMDGTLDNQPTTLVVALYGTPVKAVAGISTTANTTMAATDDDSSFVAKLGLSVQSMTPAVIGSVILLFAGGLVALLAHTYRRRLPPAVKRSWRYHHGLYKAIGLTSVAIVIVALYSGGQI